MGTFWAIAVLILIIIWFFFSSKGQVKRLHMIYELDASAEKKFKVATKMFKLSMKEKNEKLRLDSLHKTLDVILCGGKFDTINDNSEFHKNYWELGNKTALEIKKLQPILNIETHWFANDYDSALKLINEFK